MGAPRLEAEGLVVVRDGRRILDGASFALARAAVASVEGASGSGKSTLLKALATLTPTDAGRVLLEGADAETLDPTVFRRRVAYVAQQPPMLEGTVSDNVAAGPALHGRRLDAGAIDALLERVDLGTGFAARDARDLSGGERQRVALARALANEPVILLLDEPTSALDPEASARVLDLVVELAKSGLSIVVVTHIEEHAARLGGDRYVCREGRVERRPP